MSTHSRVERLDKYIASTIQARHNCIERDNTEWQDKHEDVLNKLANLLPSGSGIDNGTSIDWQKSTADKLVMYAPFHHMDDGGMYDGWTEHTITVRPSFIGDRDIKISGPNRNDIKEYLHQTFDHVLGLMVEHSYDHETEKHTIQLRYQ